MNVFDSIAVALFSLGDMKMNENKHSFNSILMLKIDNGFDIEKKLYQSTISVFLAKYTYYIWIWKWLLSYFHRGQQNRVGFQLVLLTVLMSIKYFAQYENHRSLLLLFSDKNFVKSTFSPINHTLWKDFTKYLSQNEFLVFSHCVLMRIVHPLLLVNL